MRDPRRRLERLAYAHVRHMATTAGRPSRFTADQVLDEARRSSNWPYVYASSTVAL
jgi:hypothetical protein